MSKSNPFASGNPLYKVAAGQNFANESMQLEPIIQVLELLFSKLAFGNFFINVIDFRDFSYPYNSHASEVVIGYTPSQMSNLDWLVSVIHPDDLPVFLDYGSKVMSYISSLPRDKKRRAMINHCFRILHGTRKEYIWLYQQHHMSYLDRNDAIVFSISFVTDVTNLLPNQQRPTWSVTERTDTGESIYHLGSAENESMKKSPYVSLSNREKEILKLAARGFKSAEISEQLGISFETVATHKRRIMKKTRSKNIAEAVALQINLGFL